MLPHTLEHIQLALYKRNRKARLSLTIGAIKVVRESITEAAHRIIPDGKCGIDYHRNKKTVENPDEEKNAAY